MVRQLSLFLVLAFLLGSITLCGLLTNWFRYGLSLEAAVVFVAIVVSCAVVLVVCSISYTQNNARLAGVAVATVIVSIAFVLVVYNQTMGGLPKFYLSHIVRSPPDVIQTTDGRLRYWVELRNPFSRQHEEYLMVRDGETKGIKLQLYTKAVGMYVGATKPSDWSTLTPTKDPNIAIFTTGPSLAVDSRRFQVNLAVGTATVLQNDKETYP